MVELIVLVLVACLVSVLCFFLKKRVREFLFQVAQVLKIAVLHPIKEWVITGLKYLTVNTKEKAFSQIDLTTIPLVLLFLIGVVFSFVNYYLLSLAMVFVVPSGMDEYVGFSVCGLFAIMWTLAEIILGMVWLELHVSMNIFPERAILWAKNTKWVRIFITSMLLALYLCGAVLSFYRSSVGSKINAQEKPTWEQTMATGANISQPSTVTQIDEDKKPIIVIVATTVVLC